MKNNEHVLIDQIQKLLNNFDCTNLTDCQLLILLIQMATEDKELNIDHLIGLLLEKAIAQLQQQKINPIENLNSNLINHYLPTII